MTTGTIRDAVANRETDAAEFNGNGVLALRGDQTWWEPKQIAALKSLGIKNATNEDLLVYFHYCQKTDLDPFSKEIYLLERRSWNKDTKSWEFTQTIQVGIDGFRGRAQTAAVEQGINLEYEPTIWYDADEKPHNVWISSDPPAAALVVVVKVLSDGTRLRVPGFCRFESYAAYGTKKDRESGAITERWLQGQWGVMGEHMIEKCAEAFALRRAFPRTLSGLFIAEELQGTWGEEQPPKLRTRKRDVQADDDGVIPGTAEPVPGGTESSPVPTAKDSAAKILAVFREHGFGTRDSANVRRAVVTGLLKAPEQPRDYVKVEDLAPEAMAHAADLVAKWVDDLKPEGGEPKDQIIAYASAIMEGITIAKQEDAEK